MFLRFIHVNVCVSGLVFHCMTLSKPVRLSILLLMNIWVVLDLLAIMNKASMNTCRQVCVDINFMTFG